MTRRDERPALFVDRDGTLNEELGYLSDLSRMRLLPGVGAAVRAANGAGWPVVVVSNQSGVARGYFTEDFAEQSGRHIRELLHRQGAQISGYYFCPHHPEGQPPYNVVCPCRKPEPGMLQRAARELGVSLNGAYMIGDRATDMATGASLGLTPILVRTGLGVEAETDLPPDFTARGGRIFDDLPQAIGQLLLTRSRHL